MRILYVCTANICRSASAEALTRDAGVDARSAGSAALPGRPGCSVAPALQGRADQHESQPLSPELVAWADLILTAARENQPAVTALDPRARSRTFTIVQAARLCQWLLDAGMLEAAVAPGTYPEGDPRRFVAPLGEDRTAWLVAELDAARGMAPTPTPVPERRRRSRRTDPPNPDDLLDPHAGGGDVHEANDALIAGAVAVLVATLAAVQRA